MLKFVSTFIHSLLETAIYGDGHTCVDSFSIIQPDSCRNVIWMQTSFNNFNGSTKVHRYRIILFFWSLLWNIMYVHLRCSENSDMRTYYRRRMNWILSKGQIKRQICNKGDCSFEAWNKNLWTICSVTKRNVEEAKSDENRFVWQKKKKKRKKKEFLINYKMKIILFVPANVTSTFGTPCRVLP